MADQDFRKARPGDPQPRFEQPSPVYAAGYRQAVIDCAHLVANFELDAGGVLDKTKIGPQIRALAGVTPAEMMDGEKPSPSN